MKEELNSLANHIAGAKGGLPQEWQDWATEIEIDLRKLANREAQPVAFTSPAQLLKYPNEQKETYGQYSEKFCVPLYTAPPAPAVQKDVEAVVGLLESGEWAEHCTKSELGQRLESAITALIGIAPPAPVVNPEFTGATAVPDGYCIMPLTLTAANGAKGALSGEFKVSRTVRCHECGGEGCDDCADAGEFEEEITVPWDTIKDIYRAAVEACRAAMLAQPVSQRYKLPEGFKLMPIEITDEIAEAIAMEARCCGGIALCIYEAALAAAPEGGN